MQNSVFSIIFAIFAILIVFGLLVNSVYFFLLRKIFILLKTKYPEKYKELGEPSLFWNNSIRNGVRVLKFLFSNDPIILKDTSLLKLQKNTKLFLLIGIGVFVIALIVFFVTFFQILSRQGYSWRFQ